MAKSLGRSSLVFSAFTMLSRLLGLLRDMLLARHFDSTITDPFFAALRIPNTLRRFFAEGSFTNAFVPVFTEVKEHNPAELAELLRRVCGTLLVLLLTVTALGVLFSGTVLALVAGVAGLLLSYYFEWPTGPTIVLTLGLLYCVSLLLAPAGLLRRKNRPRRHYET